MVDPAGMPDAVPGEGGFAASGTCLVTVGRRDAYLASGVGASRIFHSRDLATPGRSRTPRSRPTRHRGRRLLAGVPQRPAGAAVGGDLGAPTNGVDMSAYLNKHGRTWTNGGDLGGYRSGVDWLHRTRATAVAVGPTGSDVTYDGGRHWRTFDDVAFDSVQCTRDGACWSQRSGGTGVEAGPLTPAGRRGLAASDMWADEIRPIDPARQVGRAAGPDAQLEAPTGDRGEISFGKRIGEGTSMAVDRLSQVAVHDKLQLTKAGVERALAKVEDGTYGTCDVCGRPIGEGRLEALTWATLCVDDSARR